MSIHNYTRVLADGVWDVRLLALAKEIAIALPAKAFHPEAEGTGVALAFVDELTAGEITTLDTAVADHKTAEVNTHKLPLLKEKLCDAIDIRTTELREAGWEYPGASGDYYSLSTNAEAKLNAAFARRADGDFPYPLRLATVANDAILSLANATQLEAAHKQMFSAVNILVEGGLSLKAQVVAAADVAAVLAINDPR